MTAATRPKNIRTSGDTKLFEGFEAQPLGIDRLVTIWRSLPEHERLKFVLALEERIADRVMEATMPNAPEHSKEI